MWANFSCGRAKEETKRGRKAKEFVDRRSKVGIRPDGTFYTRLYGTDKSHLRERCLERDSFRCTDCGATGQLDMSHELSLGRGGDDTLGNVRSRCSDRSPNRCHAKHDRRPY